MSRIITSIIDTDLYKITMAQAVSRHYDRVGAEYRLIFRDDTQFPDGIVEKLTDQLKQMQFLRLTREEREYLEKRCGHYLKPSFLDWLQSYRFNQDEVEIHLRNGRLDITIQGLWYRTILWEVPLLALISELYYGENGLTPQKKWKEIAWEKGKKFEEHQVQLADFGTRRRFSKQVHKGVVGALQESAPNSFAGTSNVALAKEFNLTPIGTYAHEWVMAHAALFGYRAANLKAMEKWQEEFGGALGIALSDTYTSDNFLKAFDGYYARLFDGLRHDSGDPILFGEKAITHLRSVGVDPNTKRCVFSDSLTTDNAIEIAQHFRGRLNTTFGIGTHLTNDVGHKPLNMVIKLMYIQPPNEEKIPTVKLSDVAGKITGEPSEARIAKEVLRIE